MDVAALSMAMSQVNVAQQVSVSLTKDVMDNAEAQASQLLQMMEQSVNPNVGSNIDIKL